MAESRLFRLLYLLLEHQHMTAGETMEPPGKPPELETGFGGQAVSPITLRFSPAMAYRVYDEFDPKDIHPH